MVRSSLATGFSFKNKTHFKFQENNPTVSNVERFGGGGGETVSSNKIPNERSITNYIFSSRYTGNRNAA